MNKKWSFTFVVFIGLIVLLSGCGNENKVNETNSEEADAKENKYTLDNYETIFEMDWETFKKYWNRSGEQDFNVISDSEKPSYLTIRHDGLIKDGLYVSANTDEKTDIVKYAAVLGVVGEDNTDVYKASEKLILLTDASLSIENKQKIFSEHLGLGNREIESEKNLSYSENGILYKAEFELYEGKLPFLTVSVQKE